MPEGGPLEGSVALVTGASRGLGAATAIELARAGAHVVIAARDDLGLAVTDDAIRALGGEATLLPGDLTRGEMTDAIGPSLFERFGRLDILVHAAGTLGLLTPIGHFMPEDWEPTLGINTIATWRLIRTTEPLLRAAEHGRAVILTASHATRPRAYWGMFGATMAARHNLALAWAEEMAHTPLRINLFDPVRAATTLRAAAYPGEDPATLPQAATLAPAIAALCLPAETRHGVVVMAEDQGALPPEPPTKG